MQQVKVHAYRYEELSKTAKVKVMEWLNTGMEIFDWYEEKEYKEELEKLGYDKIDIKWSGFYSQGDGASIACEVDPEVFIKRNKLSKQYGSLLYWLRQAKKDCGYVNAIQIERNSSWRNYVHEKTLMVNSEYLEKDLTYSLGDRSQDYIFNVISQMDQLGKQILEEVIQKSVDLYAMIEAEHEFRYTDEYMIDMCDANGYLFDCYGSAIHQLIIQESEPVNG